jgi:NAD(P)-dependent dehydrogenase (short-subunit alcohol dehydrogenase family)
MRPLEEQTVLVTGSTDGLGKALARELAGRGATVLLHGRSSKRLEDSLHELGAATGSARLRGYLADFASLDEVCRLAGEVQQDRTRLDVLVNNAGIGAGNRGAREESAEGVERQAA